MAVSSAVYHYKMIAIVKRVAFSIIKKEKSTKIKRVSSKESLEDKEIRLRQMRKKCKNDRE